jgi:Ca2+-transporting ATPase
MGFEILAPVHLLWINLVTDSFPALALGVEKAEPGIMNRKPRKAKDGVFSGGLGWDVAYQGLMVSVLVLASYFIGINIDDAAHGMTMAFLTMSMAEIFHSFNMRSQRKSIFTLGHTNVALWLAGIGALAATVLVCEVPFLAAAFGFTPVGIKEFAIAAGLGICVIPIVEIVKFFQRLFAKKNG